MPGSPWTRLLALCATSALGAQTTPPAPTAKPDDLPRTRPETTEFRETSSAADVLGFLRALSALPRGDHLSLDSIGQTHEGRDLWLLRIAAPAPTAKDAEPRLRALVLGNIHAGEVEGKEALQLLAREFAAGQHQDLLADLELYFLPVYNADGNERLGRQNRPGQNGPEWTGQRPNAQGLDLNRDFVKADAPETRALLAAFTRLDPDLFVDLHTTNGSYHGYHLTYAPSLSPNVAPAVAAVSRALLDRATAAMAQQGFATFDYGNFETRDWDGSGAPESKPGVRGWYTYDHRPRYGVNYFALRHRVAILSEAYSNCDFATRVAATRAFVLALLHGAAADRQRLRAAARAAEAAAQQPGQRLGFDTTFAAPESLPVLVGAVDTVPAPPGGSVRHVRKGDGVPEVMPVVRAFTARQFRTLPAAWAIREPSADLQDRLRRHGIECTVLAAERTVRAERFAVAKKVKPKRPYQGHQELVLHGTWGAASDVALAAGTLWVPARQRFSMLAAQLLEAESEDSLSSWNFLEAATGDEYPVLRIQAPD
ncbi:MAG: M14 family metallopeptidase [Planctomycetes bacterium]|nr:M14 family metallopeptidase [Planctomycetota bacterium]